MARPRTHAEPRIPTAVRLPQDLHRRLHQVAAERAVSANLLVTRAVEEYLDRLPSLTETIATTEAPAVRP